jgi:hypothetical protein
LGFQIRSPVARATAFPVSARRDPREEPTRSDEGNRRQGVNGLVLYSLIGPAPLHERQLLRSIRSLRRWNRSIPVEAHLYGPVTPDLHDTLQRLGVAAHRLAIEAMPGPARHITLHKWLTLSRVESHHGDVLYLDCDTMFFDDVSRIFRDHREHDWYAREEAWWVDEDAWRATSVALTGRFVPPFNTGVCLVRRSLRDALSQRLDELFDFHARLEASLAAPDTSVAGERPIASPTSNPWINEQVALWLTLGRCVGTTFGHFKPDIVTHSLEFTRLDPRGGALPIVCHYFNNHRDEFESWLERNASALESSTPEARRMTDPETLPALDAAPSYLEVGLWEYAGDWPDVEAACRLNPTARIGDRSITFADPITGLQRRYRLHAQLRTIVEEISDDPAALAALPTALRERLAAVGLLEDPEASARRRKAWRAWVRKARRQFERDGYVAIPPLLSPVHLGWLRQRYRQLVRNSQLNFGDAQCSSRWIAHNESAARSAHDWFTPLVSDLAGQAVKPSYLYLGCYEAGASLPEHVDRPQCEFSLSMLMDYLPEPGGVSPWPIFVRRRREPVAIHQRIGEALLYRGRQVPHFRDVLPEGHMSTSVFFHFVPQEFTGGLD